MQEMMDAALKSAGLSESERAAAEAAVQAKGNARGDLVLALERLRSATSDGKATDAQSKQALDTYERALAKYRSAIQSEDQKLVKKLSVKSRAVCMALGVLDNGLGMGVNRGGRRGGGGGAGRGGGGGGRGGRGGRSARNPAPG
jgi:hypothetical protein